MAVRRRRTRAEAREQSRAALLRAGIELVARDGIDGPSLDAICARAGYTRGAFYVHFADRDEFLVAVMDEVGRRFLDAVLSAAAGAQDLSAVAGRFLTALARGDYPLAGKRGVKPHQLLAACARSPRIRARYVALVEDAIGRLADVIARDQKKSALRRDLDPAGLARLLLALVIGAHTMLELDMELDVGRLGGQLLRAIKD
jgi:TetR/AcrR family transcriptional regulator, transcriptional repressor for nem operon